MGVTDDTSNDAVDSGTAFLPAAELVRWYNDAVAEQNLDGARLEQVTEILNRQAGQHHEHAENLAFSLGEWAGRRDLLNSLAAFMITWSADAAGRLEPMLADNDRLSAAERELAAGKPADPASDLSPAVNSNIALIGVFPAVDEFQKAHVPREEALWLLRRAVEAARAAIDETAGRAPELSEPEQWAASMAAEQLMARAAEFRKFSERLPNPEGPAT